VVARMKAIDVLLGVLVVLAFVAIIYWVVGP
jgi:hypothetical protein